MLLPGRRPVKQTTDDRSPLESVIFKDWKSETGMQTQKSEQRCPWKLPNLDVLHLLSSVSGWVYMCLLRENG